MTYNHRHKCLCAYQSHETADILSNQRGNNRQHCMRLIFGYLWLLQAHVDMMGKLGNPRLRLQFRTRLSDHQTNRWKRILRKQKSGDKNGMSLCGMI